MQNHAKTAEQVAGELKEFSNVAKLKIINLLAGGRSLTTTDIALENSMDVAYTSQRLKEMQQAGILNRQRLGSNTFWTLNKENTTTPNVLAMLGQTLETA